MPSPSQLQAAYALPAVQVHLAHSASAPVTDQRHAQRQPNAASLFGLWSHLSTFDLTGVLDLSPATEPDPVFAVTCNLLTRGLPTAPSLALEEALAKQTGLIERHDDPDRGSVGYRFRGSATVDADALNQALHPVDSRYQNARHYVDFGAYDNDSKFERAFTTEYTAAHPVLAQLFQPQRKLDTVAHGYKAGHVDFALELPPADTHQRENKYNQAVELRRGKVFVVEVDGKKYHEQWKDDARDFAVAEMKNKTLRITEDNPVADVAALTERLLATDYVQRCARNHANTGFAERPETLLVLLPIGVARIQRAVLAYLLSEEWAQAQNGGDASAKPTLRLAVVERDLACAQLAVDDLQQTLNRLFALDARERPGIDIELTVFAGGSERTRLANDFDLVIDNALLRRTGIFAEDQDLVDLPNLLRLRTCHYVHDGTGNPVVSARPITYRPVVEALGNDRYAPVETNVALLRGFLRDIFRKADFRDGQLPIIHRALWRNSVIGLLPTGGGKSLTYQLAALLQPGTTVVVDPIRALMADQDRGLRRAGIDKTAFVNSTLNGSERRYIQDELLAHGRLQFVFVSPERFVIQEFRDTLARMGRRGHACAYVVIDEAHCVSEWGHDFRIPYLNLGRNAQTYCPTAEEDVSVPLFGLTATASFDVLTDIERELQIAEDDGNAVVRFENTVRPEVHYHIREVRVDPREFPEVPAVWTPNTLVGGAKQAVIREMLASGPAILDAYDAGGALRQNIRYAVKQYAGQGFRDAIAVDGLDDEAAIDRYADTTAERISLSDTDKDWDTRPNGTYNYGAIVFTPHRSGWLGILNGNGSDGLFGDMEAPGHDWGFFMGADNADNGNTAIEASSFKHMDRFLRGEAPVMVATKAFGMGIDKLNVRTTFHVNLPGSIESYVQEAGRLGRDGRTGLSVVAFNDQRIPNAPGLDFDSDPEAGVHVDKQVLDFVHGLSFRGQTKEQTVLRELRTQVVQPYRERKRWIGAALMDAFPDLKGVGLNIDNKGKNLYINWDGNNDSPAIQLSNGNVLAARLKPQATVVREQMSDAPFGKGAKAMQNWLDERVKGDTYEGIETRLTALDISESQQIRFPFENAYVPRSSKHPDGFQLSLVHSRLFDKAITEELPKVQLVDAASTKAHLSKGLGTAVKEGYTWEQFVDTSPVDTDKAALKDPAHPAVRALQAAYYAPRDKADTDHAIYRLSCIGVIDTYTIDFHNSHYQITFTKHAPGTYFDKLQGFLARYTSRRDAETRVGGLRETAAPQIAAGAATEISTCLDFLTGYIYDNIRLKRRSAIDDMVGLCRAAIAIPEPLAQNRYLRDEIYFYFNAKYSRPGFRENVQDVEQNASLLDHVEENTLHGAPLIHHYISLAEQSASGEFINNCKHLRGSTMRLLRSFHERGELMVLKAFSLFVLGVGLPVLRDEAARELRAGLEALHRQAADPDDGHGDYLRADGLPLGRYLRQRLSRHIAPSDYDFLTPFDRAVLAAEASASATWLTDFNDAFLYGYD